MGSFTIPPVVVGTARRVVGRNRCEGLALGLANGRLAIAAGFEAASRLASERYYAALATIDASELDTEYKSNWGVTLSIELMMEHAFAHLIRHRRQLEVHLGIRPAGKIADP